MPLTKRPLARLRVAFLVGGVSLLSAVGGLLYAALDRIDEQRALRHRMVAERIFDEVEREISSLLEHESRRPSSAYDATRTQVERWSPFVVGYYRLDPALRIVAAHQLREARRRRLSAAVMKTRRRAGSPTEPARARGASPRAKPEPLAGLEHASSLDVLLRLNRGAKVRKRQQHRGGSDLRTAATDRNTFVIERTSADGKRQEGLVVDMPALMEFIQSWLIDRQGLGDVATLHLSGSAPPASTPYRFEHRLATPFDSRSVALSMMALDDDDATGFLVSLASLFAAAGLFGLLALYRMVAVQVQFAERRQNFVSAVTHELKTPLTAIRMYGEILADGMVPDEQTRREYYDIIKAEAERLTRLINNVMEHARIRTGERHVHPTPGDAASTVRQILGVMAPHIERQGFTVSLVVNDDLPRARFDPDALKQVLFNVFENALKYGRRDTEGALSVRCSAGMAGTVDIAIRDHGPGIPERQLGHIFEPFFRGGSELTRKQQGTGIGLTLVRDLVQRMDGQVKARSCEPGLEIRITLPSAS